MDARCWVQYCCATLAQAIGHKRHELLKYKEGDTSAILPGDNPSDANYYADIVIPTGLGHYRDGIVGRANGVVVIGGGAGTLQEFATAWGAKRPIVVLEDISGVGGLVGGKCIDNRGDPARQPVLTAANAAQAVDLMSAALQQLCSRSAQTSDITNSQPVSQGIIQLDSCE